MGRKTVTSYLNLNGNLNSGSGELRFYKLSRAGALSRLKSAAAKSGSAAQIVPAQSGQRSGTIIDGTREVPEMISDLLNDSGGYAGANVKRSGGASQRQWNKLGFGLLRTKVLGGQRGIRL